MNFLNKLAPRPSIILGFVSIHTLICIENFISATDVSVRSQNVYCQQYLRSIADQGAQKLASA